MKLSLGIVGLPNVGKSTLFNALTNSSIPAENYPFCTIDPNVGIVPVADSRLDTIARMVEPEKLVPAVIEFFDIAGLVRGAHKGEGLGNEFLTHIRNTEAIVEVLRYFKDSNVTHVENRVDPLSDKEIVELELILKDLDTVNAQVNKLEREVKQDKDKQKYLELVLKLRQALENNHLAITVENESALKDLIAYRKGLSLLTDKKILYVVNGDWDLIDGDLIEKLRQELKIDKRFLILPMNIKQEYEISQLGKEEQEEFKKELGVEFKGLELLTKACFQLLGLINFFTSGKDEVRAWTIVKGSKAPQAAGAIHSDFEQKFIAAEVCAYQDFIDNNGWNGAKEKGKLRLEGSEYIVLDGDIMEFRHGA